ncbi:MAG TPA: holo-ACP synthase [Bacillus sp. (in: firmicutes)]|uniref:holo-ACP synthase n=1 Tax=Bacillus litorisediminis TaxID=2922713 RepID=UPI001FABE932|nr:holo-ACP synthase [Bacillus litorisediminis]HWO76782.1 holo-ACP synthase [Bacillus sp. (in: firmicutes)]
MIRGIGIDIIEKKRIEKVVQRQPRFPQRILTPNEIVEYMQYPMKRKIEYLSGRFAAKEAYAKARGVGIGRELSFQSIEVQKDSNGKPYFSKPDSKGVHLSISHSQEFVVAQAIIEEV